MPTWAVCRVMPKAGLMRPAEQVPQIADTSAAKAVAIRVGERRVGRGAFAADRESYCTGWAYFSSSTVMTVEERREGKCAGHRGHMVPVDCADAGPVVPVPSANARRVQGLE
jgi:hypothetical protein